MTRPLPAVVVALVSAAWISSAAAAPQITQVLPESGPTAGGAIITIRGDGFAPSGNAVQLGAKQCPVATESPTEIQCTLPEGSGASRPIRVDDGTGQASPPYPFGYNPPVITNVTAATAPAAGGFPITIIGEYFGPPNGTARRVSVNGTAAGSCVSDAAAPHSKIVCSAPPGVGRDVPVDIIVDGQPSPPSPFTYDAPAITAIAPKTASALGGTPLTIYGENFSSRYTGDSAICTAARVGGSPCPITERAEDRITCTLPPGTSTADVSVTIGCQDSNSVALSYTQAASKCDAAKLKIVAGYAKCLATAEANAAKKGGDPSAEALAKCDAKMTTACTNAETKLAGCTQIGSCGDLILTTGRGGWTDDVIGLIR